MRSYRNTFRHRTSDQHSDDGQVKFLRSFAPDVIDLLPDIQWDRLLVIRSAPGAGKTSLLRAFDLRTLRAVCGDLKTYSELSERLVNVGAIQNSKPRKLGVRISMRTYFRDLTDLQLESEGTRKLFFCLLDAQIIIEFLRVLIEDVRLSSPTELHRVQLIPKTPHPVWKDRLGGTLGHELWAWSTKMDDSIRSLIDSVLPVSMDGLNEYGHSELYSLKALGDSDIVIDGDSTDLQPLLMIDDGQWLDTSQRQSLLDALVERDLRIARWCTERHEARDTDEIIGDGEPSRCYEVFDLEKVTRDTGSALIQGKRRRKARYYETMLRKVANRRASKPLHDLGDDSDTPFTDYLDSSTATSDDASSASQDDECLAQAIKTISARVIKLTQNKPRYRLWIEEIPYTRTQETAIRWREVEILIKRDMNKPQLHLFEVSLSDEDMKQRSSSTVKDAARLFLYREFKVPYYCGADMVAKLGDHNFDQFLRLCGDLFDEMLTRLILGQNPKVPARKQQQIILQASRRAWTEIPRRRSHGLDIQLVLSRIGALAKKETHRPTAPYAPGVSGVALSMSEYHQLLDPEFRARTQGAQDLLNALGGAIGHNLLYASWDRKCKGEEWMVLYLNRLLGAEYGLPIGLGGWRPVKLEEMCGWLTTPTTTDFPSKTPAGQVPSDNQLISV
ncbi:MAG: hypothetical protein OXI96_09240 [Acidimicrobiaceae bacterium]|nr:hypothetical protein [Acidimicrobiaceae bacterium]